MWVFALVTDIILLTEKSSIIGKNGILFSKPLQKNFIIVVRLNILPLSFARRGAGVRSKTT
jgi:hypothetical protein